MPFLFAVIGALCGALFGDIDESFLGFVLGGFIGWQAVRSWQLQSRVRELGQELIRLKGATASLRAAAPSVSAAAPAPAAAAAAPAPTPAPTPEPSPAPAREAPDAAPVAASAVAPGAVASEPPPIPEAQQPPLAAAARAATPSAEAPARPQAQPPRPTKPREPGWEDKLSATLKRWFFEGNVPVKLGMLVLMFGVAAALKYAVDAGWFSFPIEFRLAGIAAAAIGGLIWGLRETRERPVFGLALQGGAIGVLLLTIFASYRLYHLLPAGLAFGLVGVMVAGASVLAVRQNAAWLAVLGFIGGYLAPVLLSTGSGNHVALFSYYAVLNTAVLAIAWFRPWRALNLIGFAFTFIIGAFWGGKYYRPELFASVEPFLILFFLFYVALPVIYAISGRGTRPRVDGALLFGTPLVAFPLQVGLLGDDRMGLAFSALFVAAIYALLGWWSTKREDLKLVAQSAAAMALGFATLAIPLALSARWTSSAWALEGAALVWIGIRQNHRLQRWSGLALQGLAGIAYLFSLDSGVDFTASDAWPIVNGQSLNLLLLCVSAYFCSWMYERKGQREFVAIPLFLLAGFWWGLGGLREAIANFDYDNVGTAMASIAAVTAAVFALLRSPLRWPRLGWNVAVAAGFAPLLAFAAAAEGDFNAGSELGEWFQWPQNLIWPAYLLTLFYGLRALSIPRSRLLPAAHIAVLLFVAIYFGDMLRVLADNTLQIAEGWQLLGLWAPLLVLAVLAWRSPQIAGAPVARDFGDYRSIWLWIALAGLALGWLITQFSNGDSWPLPWLPVLNPIELFQIALLTFALALLKDWAGDRRDPAVQGLWTLWSGAAVANLSMMVLRGCHHLASLPWSPSLLGERIAQTSLTVTWCIAGVAAWILGSRRHNRALWWGGAALLGVVLLKLVLVDRRYLGNLAGIVSFVAVGLLLVIVGRIAPAPPSARVAAPAAGGPEDSGKEVNEHA